MKSYRLTHLTQNVTKKWAWLFLEVSLVIGISVSTAAAETHLLAVDQGGDVQTIRVEANIDGRSQLILRGNTAQWHHFDFAAPGRHFDFPSPLPTIINGVEWFPVWPDTPDRENRDCNCFSNVFKKVVPPLPQTDTTITLQVIQSRGDTRIIQSPTASNNFTLVIEFDDNPQGGPDTYVIEIDFTTPEIKVGIDIKPGDSANLINIKSKDKIPVAILSSPTFDAPSEVDRASVTFGRTGNEKSLVSCSKENKDVNGDKLKDLVCDFNAQATGFQQDDTTGVLKGVTKNGVPIQGSDSVKIVNK